MNAEIKQGGWIDEAREMIAQEIEYESDFSQVKIKDGVDREELAERIANHLCEAFNEAREMIQECLEGVDQ